MGIPARLVLYIMMFSNIYICAQKVEVYVSDAGNFTSPPWKILKFDENGENPETFINQNLAWPQDILFLEDQGICLISNFSSGRITKYDIASGNYLGNFAVGLNAPTRMKIGPDSLLYVLQWSGSGKVKRYKLTGEFVDDFTTAGVPQSIGIDWDNKRNMYVSSYQLDYVKKYDENGGDLGVFINSNLVGPTDIWFDKSGDLLVSDYDGTAVKRFDSQGNYKGNFLSGLSNSEGVGFLPNGNILIGNGATGSVKMFSDEGVYLSDFIPKNSGGLIRPNAVYIRSIGVVSVKDEKENPNNPTEFILEQNFPNPFNPTTTINYTIPKINFSTSGPERYAQVSLTIYDALGKETLTAFNTTKAPGNYTYIFDGSSLTSGVYFYTLISGIFSKTKKMLIVK
ncbi:MAG: T9SS type A sorting domain-containing protein [Melioribacteraceae bacterium]|nr:T9SS type A sorting domain-containing protein [Melioribacteraceae bacterium]